MLILVMSFTSYTQWQEDVRLTNVSSLSHTSNRSIASNDSVLHVVWGSSSIGSYEIYYQRSTDNGVSWDVDTRLTNDPGASFYPSIAVSGNVVHVIWYDNRHGGTNYEIYYKRSTDIGVSWETDTRLTNDSAHSRGSCISVFGAVVHVVWYDERDGNQEIYYKRSSDGGINWGVDTRLTNDPYISGYPSVTVSGSFVHIVWHENRDGNYEIYHKRSTDGGITWGLDTRLTNATGNSWIPFVSASNSVIHVVWEDFRDANYEIYYKRSSDGGINWGADTRLTNYPGNSTSSSITASSSVVHVVWEDFREGKYKIYYKSSIDGGVNWETETQLTNASGNSENPSVAVSGLGVHVVWQDKRHGIGDIYYKRNPTGNSIGIINISSEIPSSYSLKQNFPNPFNPNTNITFDVLRLSDVKLTVFDMLGKEVTTLVNDQLKPGTYVTNWNASGEATGVYFYELTAGDYSETKKMILLK